MIICRGTIVACHPPYGYFILKKIPDGLNKIYDCNFDASLVEILIKRKDSPEATWFGIFN